MQYPYYDLCFTITGFSAAKDFDNIYLGFDNFLELKATVNLEAYFKNDGEVQAFYQWWEKETRRGVDTFVVPMQYMGERANFGITQLTALEEKLAEDNTVHYVSFKARIEFKPGDVDNEPPIAKSNTVFIPIDSRDNFIQLTAFDKENDPLTYRVQVPPAHGTLSGAAPAVIYTPDPGFEGIDCFSFVARDFWSDSKPAVITLDVKKDSISDHIVKYELDEAIRVTGNFHYDLGEGNWVRGFGGFVGLESNRVKDSQFADPALWDSVDAAWSFSGGVAVCDGTQQQEAKITQQNAVDATEAGKRFHVLAVVDDVTSGSLTVDVGGGTKLLDTVGIHSFYVTVAADTGISVVAPVGFKGSISKLEVEKVSPSIRIASHDHKLDERDAGVLSTTVEQFGSRTDYKNYLKNVKSCSRFSIGPNAGTCQGEDFESAFEGTTFLTMPEFYWGHGVNLRRAFANSEVQFLFSMQCKAAIYCEEMFKGAKVARIVGVNTPIGQYFTEMFSGAGKLHCVGLMNTTKKLSTVDMFKGTGSLVNPDTSHQADLLNGDAFIDRTGCGVTIKSLVKISGSETCEITSLGGKCKSTGTYKVTDAYAVGAVTYAWTVKNGKILSGNGTDTVQVETETYPAGMALECVVTDTVASVSSGFRSFPHKRTTAYLELVLPKSYKQIILKDFINARNPQHKTVVIVRNNTSNCSVHTGNLAGLDVTLVNNGKLSGFGKGRKSDNYSINSGFFVTSAVKLINNGVIRGAGGYGGKGGKGKNSTYDVRKEQEYYSGTGNVNSWQAYCDSGAIRIFLDGKSTGSNGDCTQTGPYNSPSPGKPGQLYRGQLKWYSGNDYIYSVKRVWNEHHVRYGGDGGLGGQGAGYNQAYKYGEQGKPSTPAGGNSGGRGGTGGDWGKAGGAGKKGAGGGANGQAGYPAAPAVVGANHITWLKSGNIIGGVTS